MRAFDPLDPLRGPMPPWAALPGRLLTPLYRFALHERNRAFDRGRGVRRVPVPVISIGNLSVGGTGKTPVVAWLARRLHERSIHPVIAMRGYAAERSASGEFSDEAHLVREHAPFATLLVNPDRFAAVSAFLKSPHPSNPCVILDDGFQHRALARDLDIILIDATRPPSSDHLLPRGWLREPISSLRRAQGAIITHAEAAAPGVVAELSKLLVGFGVKTIAVTAHEWSSLVTPDGEEIGVESLAGRRLAAVCAIGNPGPFLARAASLGPIGVQVVLADHDPYLPHTVDRVISAARGAKAEAIITTEKDWTKLASVPAARWPCPIYRVRLALDFHSGASELLATVLSTIESFSPTDRCQSTAPTQASPR